MSTEVATLEPREIVITDEQTELIKKTICAEATDAEMRLFFYDCQRRGVHPLDKLIHFTKRGKVGQKKYTPITSIDFFRIRAHASNVFDGEDEPVYEVGADGLPDSCKYVVYRLVQGRPRPWHATARWDEYYPGEEGGFLWKKMPYVMLTKCAEALALRKAFPAELQGLYVKEEMDQAGPEHKPLPKGPEMLAKMEAKSGPVDEYPRMHESARPLPIQKGSVIEPAVEEVLEEIAAQTSMGNPQDYISRIKLSESVRECSQVGNEAEADKHLSRDDVFGIRKLVKQRMVELGKK